MADVTENGSTAWPSLVWQEWAETANTLHMWTHTQRRLTRQSGTELRWNGSNDGA